MYLNTRKNNWVIINYINNSKPHVHFDTGNHELRVVILITGKNVPYK